MVDLVERGIRFARLAGYAAAGLLLGYGVDVVLADPRRALLAAGLVGLLYALEGRAAPRDLPPGPPPSARISRRFPPGG